MKQQKRRDSDPDPLGILGDEWDHLALQGEGAGIFDYFSPRDNYINTSRRTLEQLGNAKITAITLSRAPIKSVLTTALDFISSGKFSELKRKYGFSHFFHLSMIVDLDANGTRRKVVVEKNAVISISASIKTEADAEYLSVPVTGSITLSALMDKAKAAMGSKYFPYDAFKNNCQVFIDSVLKSNNLLTPTAHTWLFQDIEQLAKEMPEVSKQIANVVTTTGAIVDKVVGNGISEAWFTNMSAEERRTLFDELRRKPDAIPFFHLLDAWGILEMRELKRRIQIIKDEIRKEDTPMVGGSSCNARGSVYKMDELIFASIDRVLAKRKRIRT